MFVFIVTTCWKCCALLTILCVCVSVCCIYAINLSKTKWYSTTDILAFMHSHTRLLVSARVFVSVAVWTGLYKCTVKCHNKHFVCAFDCFAYGPIFRQMIIVMFRWMCFSNPQDTRANTTFDRFCSIMNSHLTTQLIPMRAELCDRRFDRYVYTFFYSIRVIDNKNWFLWFRSIFYHLIRGLLHCWLKCGDWKDRPHSIRRIFVRNFHILHRTGEKKTQFFHWNNDFQQLFSVAVICPYMKHTKCMIQ